LTTDYLVGPAILDDTVRVTATAAEAGATLEVAGIATAPGSASFPLELAAGVTPVAVTVTSADGRRTATTTIVFVRGAPAAQKAFVKASNTDGDDLFGASVALDGDTLVVGALGEDGNGEGVNPGPAAEANDTAGETGAVYVFVRNGGTWAQQAYLKSSDPVIGALFGASVAISGDTIVVGAPGEEGFGAAYVFLRRGTTWVQQANLKASNGDVGDEFGNAVAISGDTLVVGGRAEASAARGVNPGAAGEADDSAPSAGAAYVFVRNGNTWSQQAYVKASNTERDDLFGHALAISKNTLVVGAFTESGAGTGVNPGPAAELDNGLRRSGAAYVFVRNGTTWTQEAYVKASNTGEDDFFGISVSLSGDTLVVGATGEASAATGVDPAAPAQDDDSAPGAGAAYVFVRASGVWTQQAYLKASNAQGDLQGGDVFGFAVALSGDTLVVGASFEDGSATGVNPGPAAEADDGAPDSGAAYVFVRTGTTWAQTAYVKASNAGAGDGFASSVALSGDTLVAGAPQERSAATGVNPAPPAQSDDSLPGPGAVYVFR
jgi:hypothetical protein